jgi:DNA polymerase-3 subunit beta
MEFRIKKETMLHAMGKIQGITGKKSNLPITSNVVVYAREDRIDVLATDLEIAFQGYYEAEVLAQGGSAVPSRKLYEIVKDFPSDVVVFKESENHWIQIANTNVEYNIVGMATDEFPGLPTLEGASLFQMDVKVLKNMIEKTIYAAVSDEARAHLAGVFFEIPKEGEEKKFRMVSTDGHRLSMVDQFMEEAPDFGNGVIVPKSGIVEVLRLLEGGENIEIGLRDNHVVVKMDNETLVVRLIEGEFPDYNLVIPKKTKGELIVDRDAFLMMLRRMSILSSDKYRSVRFKVEKGELEATTTNPDLGESREAIGVSYSGDPVEIAFNPRYFIEAVSAMRSSKLVLGINDEATPCILKGEDDPGFLSVIMPMRI